MICYYATLMSMSDKFYKGIQERTFYREGKAYSDFLAVFEDAQGLVTCATHDFFTQACINNGSERQALFEENIYMFQIERAHKDMSYQKVRQDISGKVTARKPIDDLASLRGMSYYEFRGEKILGTPSQDNLLKCFHHVDCCGSVFTCDLEQ